MAKKSDTAPGDLPSRIVILKAVEYFDADKTLHNYRRGDYVRPPTDHRKKLIADGCACDEFDPKLEEKMKGAK